MDRWSALLVPCPDPALVLDQGCGSGPGLWFWTRAVVLDQGSGSGPGLWFWTRAVVLDQLMLVHMDFGLLMMLINVFI